MYPYLSCINHNAPLHVNLPSFLCLESVFASLPQMERGASKVIGGDPKGNNFLYTNGKCVIIRSIEVISHLLRAMFNEFCLLIYLYHPGCFCLLCIGHTGIILDLINQI